MKIRGRRKCKSCGTRWSYYDTGAVSCPECGALESVGVDEERLLHTATAAELDLTPVRNRLDTEPIRRLSELARDRAREFTRGYGFIHEGTLTELDDTYLAAAELRSVSGELAGRMNIDDDEKRYFVELLEADDGVRPDPADVPPSLRSMRGIAYADAVKEYRTDLRTYLEENPDPRIDDAVERLSSHRKRIQALQGDVIPEESERLIAIARDLGRHLGGEEAALARAESGLDSLMQGAP